MSDSGSSAVGPDSYGPVSEGDLSECPGRVSCFSPSVRSASCSGPSVYLEEDSDRGDEEPVAYDSLFEGEVDHPYSPSMGDIRDGEEENGSKLVQSKLEDRARFKWCVRIPLGSLSSGRAGSWTRCSGSRGCTK